MTASISKLSWNRSSTWFARVGQINLREKMSLGWIHLPLHERAAPYVEACWDSWELYPHFPRGGGRHEPRLERAGAKWSRDGRALAICGDTPAHTLARTTVHVKRARWAERFIFLMWPTPPCVPGCYDSSLSSASPVCLSVWEAAEELLRWDETVADAAVNFKIPTGTSGCTVWSVWEDEVHNTQRHVHRVFFLTFSFVR